MVEMVVDVVVDAKVVAIIGAIIIRIGTEMIIEMVLKRESMLGCAISIVESLDGIIPTILDLILLGSVILELMPFQPTMTIGRC